MNGAANGYDLVIYPPVGVVFWEPDENDLRNFNDGASSPDEGLTARHGQGGVYGEFNGAVDFIKQSLWNIGVKQTNANQFRIEMSPWTTQNSSQAVKDPDHLLVRGVQEGKMDAFDALVGKYKQPIVNFAARVLGDAMEAQDVAQNAFVCVFKTSGRFRFACQFSTWLYTPEIFAVTNFGVAHATGLIPYDTKISKVGSLHDGG